MAQKNVDFVVSGIWKNVEGVITNLFLHKLNADKTFDIGVKMPEKEVIGLIKRDKLIKTIYWNYPNWKWGEKIEIIHDKSKGEYLRTDPNNTGKDNLDNIYDMRKIIE